MHWSCSSYDMPWAKILPGDTVSSARLIAYPVGDLILRGSEDPNLRVLRLRSSTMLVVAIVPGCLEKGGIFAIERTTATFFFLSRHGLLCVFGDR